MIFMENFPNLKKPPLTYAQNNKTYEIQIEAKNNIFSLIIKDKGKSENDFYSFETSLTDLQKKNEVFQTYTNIEKLTDVIKKRLDKNKITFIEEKGSLQMIFYIFNEDGDKIKVNFILKPKPQNSESKVKKLESKIKIIEKTLNDKDERISELEEKLKAKDKQIEQFKQRLNSALTSNHQNEYQFNEAPKPKINIFEASTILKTKKEYTLISTAITERLKKDIKQLRLLYKATIDGDEASAFHSKCDNIPNTLMLAMTRSKRRFGGFTTKTWEGKGSKDDKSAFLFSLDRLKVYKYKEDRHAIYCNPNFGPTFGRPFDIKIENKCMTECRSITCETSIYCSFDYGGDSEALTNKGSDKIDKGNEDAKTFVDVQTLRLEAPVLTQVAETENPAHEEDDYEPDFIIPRLSINMERSLEPRPTPGPPTPLPIKGEKRKIIVDYEVFQVVI